MEHHNKINSKEFKRIANPHTKIPVKPGPKKEGGHAKAASINNNVLQNQVIKTKKLIKLKKKPKKISASSRRK